MMMHLITTQAFLYHCYTSQANHKSPFPLMQGGCWTIPTGRSGCVSCTFFIFIFCAHVSSTAGRRQYGCGLPRYRPGNGSRDHFWSRSVERWWLWDNCSWWPLGELRFRSPPTGRTLRFSARFINSNSNSNSKYFYCLWYKAVTCFSFL